MTVFIKQLLFRIFCVTVSILPFFSASAQLSSKEHDSLRLSIIRTAATLNARVGVAVSMIETADTLTYRADERFPMMSVYKFPIAIAVLKEMDRGNLWMEKYAQVNKDSVFSNEAEKFTESIFPGGKVTIGQLLTLMLVQGSNTACDKLLEVLKGPRNVQPYLDDLDIHDMSIARTEREMSVDSLNMLDNWSTPAEMNRLLSVAYTGDYLSVKNHDFLWEKMGETVTGPDRIKGLLPRGTMVMHRTGTGYGSYNDVGIVTLPKGKHLVISVFVADAQDPQEKCGIVIARIAKLAWDYYSKY